MAVTPDIISGYILVIRGDMKIIAIILRHKIIYYTRLCSKIMEIKSLQIFLKLYIK